MRREDPLFDPSCCKYKLSGRHRKHLDQVLNNDQVDPKTRRILSDLLAEEEAQKSTLSYESLGKLHKYLQRADSDYVDPFYLLLEECKCIPPPPRDNEQLEARLQRLRLRNSHNIYHSMTASVDRQVERLIDNQADGHDRNAADGRPPPLLARENQLRILDGAFMAVVNSFLVYICTFVFCYKAMEYSLTEPHIIAQVLFGLLGSTVVACAELYFLARVI